MAGPLQVTLTPQCGQLAAGPNGTVVVQPLCADASLVDKIWYYIKEGIVFIWNGFNWVWTEVETFLNWLDNQAGEAEKWLLLAGIGALLYAFSPSINDAVHKVIG